MNILRTILAGLTGTSVMTLFSYLVSRKENKEFKEPVILSKLLTGGLPNRKNNDLYGWALHYAVGLIFSSVYDRLWQRTSLSPSTSTGLILGGITGLVGIGVWSIAFKLHPDPPHVPQKKYYGHLLAAHLFFGVFAALAYRKFNAITRKSWKKLV